MYMHACIHEFIKICITNIIKKWGETTRGEMVLGTKRLGCGGETTKGKNRSETTLGETAWMEMIWGRNILLP